MTSGVAALRPDSEAWWFFKALLGRSLQHSCAKRLSCGTKGSSFSRWDGEGKRGGAIASDLSMLQPLDKKLIQESHTVPD
mmetsp:Transcript_147511/g.410892  ORF Transcript_147511/g.410892 Transcript_147511/m.410892 type:complete len:80 (+) Transcript_147511:25-264(+)